LTSIIVEEYVECAYKEAITHGDIGKDEVVLVGHPAYEVEGLIEPLEFILRRSYLS
jgi:hypothetical protein